MIIRLLKDQTTASGRIIKAGLMQDVTADKGAAMIVAGEAEAVTGHTERPAICVDKQDGEQQLVDPTFFTAQNTQEQPADLADTNKRIKKLKNK